MGKILIKFPTLITSELESHFAQFDQMIQNVVNEINHYNNRAPEDKITIPYRGKSKTKCIKSINPINYTINNIPSIIICVREYKQGYNDLYYQNNANLVNLTPDDKIGSDENYALLYPIIERKNSIWTNKWLVIIYDTPNKDDSDIINTIKYTVSKVLSFPFKFILPTAISGDRVIPELQVTYVEIENNENENFILHDKIVESKIKKTKNVKYIDLSTEEATRIIQDTDEIRQGIKRSIKIWHDNDNRQATSVIKQECLENGEISSYVTSKYGYQKELSAEDLPNMNQLQFMTNAFNEVLNNYITNGLD